MSVAELFTDQAPLLLAGDCAEALAGLAPNSVDAIVTDPPYGLGDEPPLEEVLRAWMSGERYVPRGGGFMGKTWDAFVPDVLDWRECFRVLKPGGHLLAFSGTRTLDLIGVGLRLAGFERRDCLAWLFGSGFPKNHDVAKAIDAVVGAEGEWRQEEHFIRPGVRRRREADGARIAQTFHASDENPDGLRHVYDPASDEAKAWRGWGTAMKPAFEPIIVARKPLEGTVARNVLAHGTGALNIDACRIAGPKGDGNWAGRDLGDGAWFIADQRDEEPGEAHEAGRWPANVILDEDAAAMLDAQTGTLTSGTLGPVETPKQNEVYGRFGYANRGTYEANSGGASRFFYVAKVSPAERNAGLGLGLCTCETIDGWETEGHAAAHRGDTGRSHPTDTDASGIPANDGCEWSTSSSGKPSTAPSPRGSRSTTSTATNSTTESTTSNSSTTSRTDGSTPPSTAFETMESGSITAPSATSGSPRTSITSTSPNRDGSATGDVGPATSERSSSASSSSERLGCSNCGGVIEGARRNAHPT